MSNPPTSALIEFIKDTHTEYYGKILELRTEVEEWLSYIPNTFQHYTTHTIKHSDEIVNQISKLLFKDSDWKKPIIRISGVEAYILVAAAYLHDAGMVTSEKEKSEILESETWKKWISGEESRAKRWDDIKRQREENPAKEEATRNFLADLQTRFMIAEFVRGQHHLRAGNLIEVHHEKLGRIGFESRMLREAIAQVCIGHGLRQHELEDSERFPESRDIRGETVNLRFLAILLRLGDLLDMSETRACPLLLNAASPLPSDSLAHWSQYEAIRHRLTSPETIEVRAECENQEEDRILRDWCQWIVDEVRNAKIVMAKARRHKDWNVPDASMEGDTPSINIRPAKDADYIPSNWLLDFDKQAIFNLLAEDLYQNPLVFVRELIQNSLDAIRCKMYSDLEKEGKEKPEYPTQVAEDFRYRYSVRLSVSEREKVNAVSGETETEQVVIEDDGIGMDCEIIEKYFLQVGRSFYKSDEFRRNFQFVPTSRFGIGFLSVFAASDRATVDSYKPTSEMQNNEPVKITLTGLRNYLLRDKSKRDKAGTRIEIVLRENIEQGKLTEMVADWCKRVEFPVIVDDFSQETRITAERPEQFTFEHQLVTDSNAKYIFRSFPVNRSGIEGEIYILAYIDENGENWTKRKHELNTYKSSHPLAVVPIIIDSLDCFHGIKIREHTSVYPRQYMYRLDFRDKKFLPTLSRGDQLLSVKASENDNQLIDAIQSEYEKILTGHLAESVLAKLKNGWKYRQSLIGTFPGLDFWDSLPETIPVYIDRKFKLISLNEFLELEEFYSLDKFSLKHSNYYSELSGDNSINIVTTEKMDLPVLNIYELEFLSDVFIRRIRETYTVSGIVWMADDYLRIHWTKIIEMETSGIELKNLIDFDRDNLFTMKINIARDYYHTMIIFNKIHPFGEWLSNIIDALNAGQSFITEENFRQLFYKFYEFADNGSFYNMESLKNYLEGFKTIPGLPADFQPPDIEITFEMFSYENPNKNDK